jgi:hypothetical protein
VVADPARHALPGAVNAEPYLGYERLRVRAGRG